MPRKKRQYEVASWHLEVPKDLAKQVDGTMLNALTGRVEYGARASLVIRLLREWLSARAAAGNELAEMEGLTHFFEETIDEISNDHLLEKLELKAALGTIRKQLTQIKEKTEDVSN